MHTAHQSPVPSGRSRTKGPDKKKAGANGSMNQSSSGSGKYLMKIKEGSVPFSFPNLGWALKNRPEETLDINKSPVDRINFLYRAPDQGRMDGLYSLTRSDSHKERMKGLFGTYFGGKPLNLGGKPRGNEQDRLGTPRSKSRLKNWQTIIELEICQALSHEPEALGACLQDAMGATPLAVASSAAEAEPESIDDTETNARPESELQRKGSLHEDQTTSSRAASGAPQVQASVVRSLENPPTEASAAEEQSAVHDPAQTTDGDSAPSSRVEPPSDAAAAGAGEGTGTSAVAGRVPAQGNSEVEEGGDDAGQNAEADSVAEPSTAALTAEEEASKPEEAPTAEAADVAPTPDAALPTETAPSAAVQRTSSFKFDFKRATSKQPAHPPPQPPTSQPSEPASADPLPATADAADSAVATESVEDQEAGEVSQSAQTPNEAASEEASASPAAVAGSEPGATMTAVPPPGRAASFKFNFKRVGSLKPQAAPDKAPQEDEEANLKADGPASAIPEPSSTEEESKQSEEGDGVADPAIVSDADDDGAQGEAGQSTPDPVPSEQDLADGAQDHRLHTPEPEVVASRAASAQSAHAGGDGVDMHRAHAPEGEAGGAEVTPEYTPAGSPEPEPEPEPVRRSAGRTPEPAYTPCYTPADGSDMEDSQAVSRGSVSASGQRRRWPAGHDMRRLPMQQVVKISGGSPLSERVTRAERHKIIKEVVRLGGSSEGVPRPPSASAEVSFSRKKRWWQPERRAVGGRLSVSALPANDGSGEEEGAGLRGGEGEGVCLPIISSRRPIAEIQEAVRQCLRPIFDLAQDGYVFFDIRTVGELSVNDFRRGWERLRIYHIAPEAAFNALVPEKDFKSFAKSFGWHAVHNYNQALAAARLERKALEGVALGRVAGRPFVSTKMRAAAAEQAELDKSMTKRDSAVQAVQFIDVDPLHHFQAALQLYFEDAAQAFCFFDAKGSGKVSKAEFERGCHKLLLFEIHTDGAMERLDWILFDRGPMEFLDFVSSLSWGDMPEAEQLLESARRARPDICARAISVAVSRTPLAESVARNQITYQRRRVEGQRRLESIHLQKQQLAAPNKSISEEKRVPIRPRKYSPLTPMGQLQELLKDIFSNSAEAFVFFDTTGNNCLSESELLRALQRLGAPAEWTAELLWSMDKDVRDGAVDAFEFVKYLSWGQMPDFFDALKQAQDRRRDIIIQVSHALRTRQPQAR